jgi:hypothetical protein
MDTHALSLHCEMTAVANINHGALRPHQTSDVDIRKSPIRRYVTLS